ncbi:tetratricopeptide repeat protein [Burkholderia sp. BCC1977]|uniref:tetratricopeptide repeat protein n=1 Tax=Burkholderia sp. BCC1977 TaxID=2817440 RepID=UPI002ABE540B|nr:tetratricopeptide repeat protein [Burkholderia sp. BCC1977]
MHTTTSSPEDRVQRLLSYLSTDPTNRSLRIDLAHAAFDSGQHDLCERMLDALRQDEPQSAALLNLEGLNALARGLPERAIEVFRSIPAAARGAVVQYNEAYALALTGQYEEALNSLTAADPAAMPLAVALRIRVLHHLKRLEEALALGEQYAESVPEIAAPYAVALFDAGNADAARTYAQRAGHSPDAWVILALLDLETGAIDAAEWHLARALQYQPEHARAQLGMGLVQMARRQFDAAGNTLSAAARSFRSHSGAWIAAGWAYLYKGDLATARRAFDTAVAVDRTFAEAHGSLAVLDIKEGLLASARTHIETAQRLDKACASAALALGMLQDAEGESVGSKATIDAALRRPFGTDNRTLLQRLATYTGNQRAIE